MQIVCKECWTEYEARVIWRTSSMADALRKMAAKRKRKERFRDPQHRRRKHLECKDRSHQKALCTKLAEEWRKEREQSWRFRGEPVWFRHSGVQHLGTDQLGLSLGSYKNGEQYPEKLVLYQASHGS